MDVTDQNALTGAMKYLASKDAAFDRAYGAVGCRPWRTREGGYAGLARIIAFQQLSTKAAGTIWGRVEAHLTDVTPAEVLRAGEDELRGCGLSRPKIRHLKSIAEAVESGDLCFRRVSDADDGAAREEMIAVKGVGPWTADVYLMFCLGRCDLFPHADIGLLEAYRMLTDSEERLSPKAFSERAEDWRPYRGVAAHLLWSYINAVRDGDVGGV